MPPARSTISHTIGCLFGLAAVALSAVVASAGDELLVPGERREWELAPGGTRRHAIALEPGQFLRATVKQLGIDVALRISGPGGGGSEVDASEGPGGYEPASLLATDSGWHVIEVRAAADARAPGRYSLDSDAPRSAGPLDHDRLAAERMRALAGPQLGPRSTFSRRGSPSAPTVQESRRLLESAAELWERVGDGCWEADARSLLGLVQGWNMETAPSLAQAARGLRLWEDCGDRYKLAEALNDAGEGLRRAGQFARSQESYERGLALSREIGARDLELQLLTNAASASQLLGDTDLAIRRAEEALPLLRDWNIKQGEAVALRNLALSRYRRGEFQLAVDLATESVALRREIGDRPGEATTLLSLAEAYLALGDPAAALRHLDEVRALFDGGVLPAGGRPRLMVEMAKAHEQLGDRGQARQALEQSLALRQADGDLWGQGLSLVALGRFHLRGRSWDEAQDAGARAVALLRQVGDRFELANALELQGAAWLGQGRLDDAPSALAEAVALRRLTGDRAGEASGLHHLARVDRARGDSPAARARLEEALRLVESQRAQIPSPDRRSAWHSTVKDIHDAYVETLMDLHRRDGQAGWDARAFAASEAGRARSLLDLLTEAGLEDQEADPELRARERSLRGRLGTLLDRQVRAAAREDAPAGHEEMAREVQALTMELERVRGLIRTASPRSARAEAEPLDLAAIQARVLDGESLLLAYFLGEERSFLWAATPGSLRSYELPGRADIEDAARQGYEALSARPDRRGSAARLERALAALGRMLLAPAAAELKGKRLVIVPDGILHYLPFAALPDPAAPGRPLIAGHEVVSAPSASAVDVLRRERASRPPAPKTLLALADPVFDSSDERVAGARPGPGPRAPRDRALARAAGELGLRGAITRLPFTRWEARRILALVPPGQRREALDFDANRATVLRSDLADYRLVHLATHGFLNSARPELSGVVLSLVDPQGREQEGFLAAPEVFKLRLAADLVVLSGCHTGLGKQIRGEGLVGLSRAFLHAGAVGVVASSWKVDDAATAELMARFYQGMLGPKRLRPAAALRAAQRSMLGDRWRSPYYWAAFQLQGDWH